MPSRRKGAPGSFGAPLDQLLPRIGTDQWSRGLSIDVHRKPRDSAEAPRRSGECRIFMLNQGLYDQANK